MSNEFNCQEPTRAPGRNLPSLELAGTRQRDLAELKTKLGDLGYSEQSIVELLGIHPGTKTHFGQLHMFDRYFLDPRDPLNLALRAFFLTLPVQRSALESTLGIETMELLCRLGLFSELDDDSLRADYTIFPVGAHLIATDRAFETDPNRAVLSDTVMCLGGDSYSLAAIAYGYTAERALDLCTGSGATAIVASERCSSVAGGDINPRAIELARLNALINETPGVRFDCGDIYAPYEGRTFDLITANPPFVPAPSKENLIYRDGGLSGEDVLSRILRGLERHLDVGGTCLIMAGQVEHEAVAYADKVTSWLGDGFDVVLLSGELLSIVDVALTHNPPLDDAQSALTRAFEWVDSYRAEGIVGIRGGQMLIRRRDAGSTRVVRLEGFGASTLGQFEEGFVDELFRRLELSERRGVANMKLTFVGEASEVRLESPVGFDPIELEPPLFEQLAALSPESPALPQILTNLEEEGYEVGPEQEEDLEETLRHLYLTGILDASDQ